MLTIRGERQAPQLSEEQQRRRRRGERRFGKFKRTFKVSTLSCCLPLQATAAMGQCLTSRHPTCVMSRSSAAHTPQHVHLTRCCAKRLCPSYDGDMHWLCSCRRMPT